MAHFVGLDVSVKETAVLERPKTDNDDICRDVRRPARGRREMARDEIARAGCFGGKSRKMPLHRFV